MSIRDFFPKQPLNTSVLKHCRKKLNQKILHLRKQVLTNQSTFLSRTHCAGEESCLFRAWGGCGGGTLGLLPCGFFCGPPSGNVGNGAWVVSGEGGGFISEPLGRGTENALLWAAGKRPAWFRGGPLARFGALCWIKDLLGLYGAVNFSVGSLDWMGSSWVGSDWLELCILACDWLWSCTGV